MSRWKDRRRIAMLQCNVQTRTCSPRRSVIAGMAVSASQLGKLWTWCPVDVEEDGGEGEMVRGEEPFWRRTKAKARQEEQACMCMHASALAGLRVPVVPVLCVCPCAWVVDVDQNGWIPPDAFTPAAGPPGISSPKIGFDRALPRSRGSENGRQTSRDRTCEAEAEGGCQCGAGAFFLPQSLSHSLAPHHNTRTNPSPHIIRSLWGCKWCKMIAQSVKRARIDKHIIKRVSSS